MDLTSPVIERASGLVVPAHLAHAPDPEAPRRQMAVDADGRRRVVITKSIRRLLARLARELKPHDVALVLACRKTRVVLKEAVDPATGHKTPVLLNEEIPGACGELLFVEDDEGPDPGYGCKCSRVHYHNDGSR